MKLDPVKGARRLPRVVAWLCLPCALSCGTDAGSVDARTGSPHSPGGGSPSIDPSSDIDDPADVSEDAGASGDTGDPRANDDAGDPDDAPQGSTPEGGPSVDASGPDGGITDEDPTPAEPATETLPRGLLVDELPEALQRYWLVDALVMGCGDIYSYERFAAADQFTRIGHSDPGCSYDDYMETGTYQLAGRRLTVVRAEPTVESQYDIAIEEDQVGLVQYVGIYLPQSQSKWVRQASRERRDESGALEWRVSSSLSAEFAAPLPLDDADICSLMLRAEVEVQGMAPEGLHLLEFGPYACTIDPAASGQMIRLPTVTTEELSGLDSVVQQEVQGAWPLFLRLPRPDAAYLLPTGGYAEIAESDLHGWLVIPRE